MTMMKTAHEPDLQGVPIPDAVVHALEAVDRELPDDIIDFETVATFVHLLGFDAESEWLGTHRALYFRALGLRSEQRTVAL